MTGKQLLARRKRFGLTQKALAKLLGVARNTVARWEREEISVPSFLHLALESAEANRDRGVGSLRNQEGCINLEYEFRYNKRENAVEVTYSFASGIPERNGTMVFRPHGTVLRYLRKGAGRKPSVDVTFDCKVKVSRITKEAEILFSQELGWAIEMAFQLLVLEVLYRSGIGFEKSPKLLANKLEKAYRRERAKRLGVKVGSPKGKKKSKVTMSKTQLETEMPLKIRQIEDADSEPTCAAVALALGLPNAKALERLRRRYEDTRRWRDVISEATSTR